jgi:hypothetical protein
VWGLLMLGVRVAGGNQSLYVDYWRETPMQALLISKVGPFLWSVSVVVLR